MSAPNFCKDNAHKYYCVGLTDENGQYTDFDFIIEDVQQVAMSEHDNWSELNDWDHDRSYPMHYCVGRDYSLNYCGEHFFADVKLGVRSAYYDGGNIDYDIELPGGWLLEHGDVDGLVDGYIEDMQNGYKDISNGLFAMNKKRIADKLRQWINNIVEDCEKICNTCAEVKLGCCGVFSNGEAIYSKVS